MKLVDTNVLLYAVNVRAAQHEESRGWLDRSLSGGGVVGFAWLALVGFVRLSTKPGVVARPLAPRDAVAVVEDWLAAPAVRVLHPTPRHCRLMGDLLAAADAGGNLANDAHLAALALEHRAEVVTYDTDFARFPGVRWSRPGER